MQVAACTLQHVPSKLCFLKAKSNVVYCFNGEGGRGDKSKNAITERGKCVRDKVTKEMILVECRWAVRLLFP
jgi:hypothetical protein